MVCIKLTFISLLSICLLKSENLVFLKCRLRLYECGSQTGSAALLSVLSATTGIVQCMR